MKSIVTAALVAAVTLPTAAVAQAPDQQPVKPKCDVTQAAFKEYTSAVYKRSNISKTALKKMDKDRSCARSKRASALMLRFQKDQSTARKQRIELASVTPFGRWAIPGYIVACESRFRRYAVNTSNPNRPAGWYQIITSTWKAYGGGRFAATADQASAYGQHVIARRIYQSEGYSPWACA